MPKYEVEFRGSYRGTVVITAEDANEAETKVGEMTDEQLNTYYAEDYDWYVHATEVKK